MINNSLSNSKVISFDILKSNSGFGVVSFKSREYLSVSYFHPDLKLN